MGNKGVDAAYTSLKMIDLNKCMEGKISTESPYLIPILDKEIKDFIKQTQTDSLKTKDYPKEFLDLKMKVSFGQGALAKVPWVALRAPDMPVSNGYNPVYLFYKEQNTLILAYGISETHIPEVSWTKDIHDTKTKISDFIENPFR